MIEKEKVLFVVYRPEWWGCFDSLCRQECSQEHIICYVMPIPRYDRDNNSKAMDRNRKHFQPEALTELPNKAKVVDFKTFSLDQMFDRIYIHNPYDNASAMDSVDAAFYSGNLKKCAKKLIYVPHLLYMGGMPESMSQCPVYDNVDAIFLSDRRVRYSLDVKYDKKVEIVPCGILEYLDKLKKQKQKSETIRNEKKRLLYCISFEDLFYGTEKQIQKMWDIFKYMETRDDIEFVFRPDEDIPFRYFGLQGEIRKKYEELVAYYKAKGAGIYDEGTNPYQAAVEADGILTAGHPMSAMFSVQGKCVLTVDRESRAIPTVEDRCIPFLCGTTIVETEQEVEVWFVPPRTKLICRMTIPNGEVEIVAEIPDEIATWLNYIAVEKVESCLYFAPFFSNGIWKYDLKSKRFSKTYLPKAEGSYMTGIVHYGEYLYMIPRNYPGIVKYHMETEEIQIIDGWIEELEQYVTPDCKKEPYFVWGIKREANMLYLASSNCNVWMEMNLDTDKWKIREIGDRGLHFINYAKSGENVWLLPRNGIEIVKWNCVTNESNVIYRAKGLDVLGSPYEFLVDIGCKLVALPQKADNVLVIDKQGFEQPRKIADKIPCDETYYCSKYLKQINLGYQDVKKLQNGKLLVYESYDGCFLLLNEQLVVEEKIPCRIPINMVKEQQHMIWEKEQCRENFSGRLHEGYSFPAMVDYFIVQNNQLEIKGYYKNFFAEK